MQDLARTLRLAGIAVGVVFLGWLLWIAVLGPSIMLLLKPRS
ncbi:MAG TPA: hypothetical protein VNF26_04600 [Candidatus Baltobacterales bacterium]|nr:hypothetical protein [Candidatus Baltobacterales bacterium]